MTSVMPVEKGRLVQNGFPLRLFAAALAIGLLAVAVGAGLSWQLQGRLDELRARQFQLTEYVSRIMLFDEALTMSARMAAATGDLAYEQRYDKFDAELDALINETKSALERPEVRQFVEQTDEANRKLVEMERRAFALALESRLTEATALLVSDEYLRLKGVYADGVEKTVAWQRGAIEGEHRSLRYLTIGLQISSGLVVLFLLASWNFALRAGRRWGQERLRSEAALRKARDDLELRITERTAELRQYAERQQLFIAAIESSDDAIVTKTLDGTISGWNTGAERLFGYKASEAINQSIDIIVPVELRADMHMNLDKIARGEKIERHETVRISKDGRRIDVSVSISPVKSTSGAIIGAAKVARDITATNKTRQALLDSERMARGIIDTALDAFVQMDDGGIIIDWNGQAEAVFGWSRDEAVGKVLGDLIVPERDRARHNAGLQRFLQSGEASILGQRVEVEAVRRDGSEIKVELSVTALRRGRRKLFNGFIRDLTEKLAAEEKLRQAQKMEAVGQLTGGIAHDFNNMLTVITGTIDILADEVSDKPNLAAIAKLISEAADRGAELTGHLLAFARKQPLQPRETDINALILESMKLMRPTLGEHVEIEPMLESSVCPALVDPGQLSTALLNLALNARDAMPNGGKLTLETDNVVLDESYVQLNGDIRPGNYVMIAVSDTGSGIPEAILNKIFEPFFSTKEVGKGTGLGLSMVYGFVKQSNGHIKVYSEEGQGTTFRIYLPQAGDMPSEQPADVTAVDPIKGWNETILVVEDDPLVRSYVTMQLHGLGYRTISAANATEAIAVLDSGAAFDLLFTDVIMPGPMNGRQLAEEVAKRHTHLKVLFTSGYTENAIIHHGRLDPGVLLLSKPYRRAELARMIRVALDAGPHEALVRAMPAGEPMTGSADSGSRSDVSTRAVYVLDDDPRVRASIFHALIASGYHALEFSEPPPMLELLKSAPPEVVVLDLALGQSDAVDVIRQLAMLKYQGKLLLISGHDQTMLDEIQRIGERHGLAMLPSLRKPFRASDIKERLMSLPRPPKVIPVPDGKRITIDLAEALRKNWLELWYQPKIDLKSFLTCGAEALLRARHPEHGIVSPAGIIPPANDPLHHPLAEFVIRRAMADWHRFSDAGMPLKLALNMPVSVIVAPDFLGVLREQLSTDPRFPGLIIEVTEDEIVNDPERIHDISTQLKLYNVWISIDDFGSAYSSLSRLLEFSCVELKLDRRFVSNCSADPLKHAICQTAVDLAHRLGSIACAEGVEEADDLRSVIQMGCDTAQGFIFAQPMPPDAFVQKVIARPLDFTEHVARVAKCSVRDPKQRTDLLRAGN